MIVIRYRLELQEPALLTGLDGDPNSAVSIEYLPGSALRGAFISTLLRHDPCADLGSFLSEQVRFLNGYIVADDSRALPLPLSLRQQKDTLSIDDEIYDGSVEQLRSDLQWKTPGASFASVDESGKGIAAEIKRQLAIHTTRDRRLGTARPDSGTVYRYDALAASQVFEAVALCERTEEANLICALVTEIDRLGGAARAGYGKVNVTLSGTEEQGWKEHPFCLEEDHDMCQIVLLLSDALVRDELGQFAVSPDTLIQAIKNGISVENAFIETTPVGAFNRTWGLPLPQALAYKQGTVLVLPARSLSESEIDALEINGIGERRSEGFGRLAVFSPPSHWSLTRDDGKRDAADIALSDPDEIEVATLISRRVNEAQQARKVLRMLTDTRTQRKELNSSQIARLREVILHETLLDSPKLSCIERFCNDLTAKTALQWRKARVGTRGEDLLSWLDGYKALKAEFRAKPPEIGGKRHIESEAEQVKRQLRFLDSVLARMQKEKEERP